MKQDVYLTTLMQVGALASLACELPLREARDALRNAETMGPILDPTLYREAETSGLLDMQRELLDALLTVRAVALRWRDLVGPHIARPAVIQRSGD